MLRVSEEAWPLSRILFCLVEVFAVSLCNAYDRLECACCFFAGRGCSLHQDAVRRSFDDPTVFSDLLTFQCRNFRHTKNLSALTFRALMHIAMHLNLRWLARLANASRFTGSLRRSGTESLSIWSSLLASRLSLHFVKANICQEALRS